ncbi:MULTISPECIES: hypothetical protein [Rhizobium]|uniref:hypothetical protein n=1 Tax=Rhizobium TaxID=379 RepID=UPI00103077AA|nr:MULTISPECIES: hypothetical protein [Rhizobium]TAX30743.1 hypothetical protein ELI04_13655 [Rhizobium leguminosarum]TBD43287.1 hypothetical protein ELH19_14195 [Rhizobium ruizarguesonis]TBE45417.1 hypothetical protein ELH02_14075 [Rhizobium ruizarguesonis]
MPMHDFPRIKKDDLVAEFPGVFDTASYTDVGVGWLGLVRDFVNEALQHDPSLTVHEIKEKWGGMRIWCDTEVTAARLAKGKAEFKSSITCEVCGAPGFVRRPPPDRMAWWRCLCDEHASPDQRSWGTRPQGPMYGYMQTRNGQWYRYDEATDSMVPSEPPAQWR